MVLISLTANVSPQISQFVNSWKRCSRFFAGGGDRKSHQHRSAPMMSQKRVTLAR